MGGRKSMSVQPGGDSMALTPPKAETFRGSSYTVRRGWTTILSGVLTPDPEQELLSEDLHAQLCHELDWRTHGM